MAIVKISAACSISMSVVNFPIPILNAPSMTSEGIPMARKTWDGISTPDVHAEPVEIARRDRTRAMTALLGMSGMEIWRLPASRLGRSPLRINPGISLRSRDWRRSRF